MERKNEQTIVYTIAEVAAMLQFSEQTIRDWTRSGRIHGVRFGTRAWRIPRSEVTRLMAQLDSTAPAIENSPSTTKSLSFAAG